MKRVTSFIIMGLISVASQRSSCLLFCQYTGGQAYYRNADVTLGCERCCVTNGYLQGLVWDVNGFS